MLRLWLRINAQAAEEYLLQRNNKGSRKDLKVAEKIKGSRKTKQMKIDQR